MEELDREAAIDRLHGVTLEEFVAERTRLSRELRKGGHRPAALEIAKLPKPSAAAWALNHVAREDTTALEAWLKATRALRDASADPGAGDALRGAMKAHRSATVRLMAVVRDGAQPSGRPLSEAMLERVRGLLQAATSDAGIAEDLRAGRLDEAREPEPAPVSEPAPASEAPARTAEKGREKAEPPPKRDRAAEARAERRAELERRLGAATEDLASLREEADRCEAASQAADERLEEARRALKRLESEATAASGAVREAAAAVKASERAVKKLRGRL